MTETYYLDGEAYTFDTQEELDAWLAENPTASKTNHATVEKMKKDVGWGFVEKDFVNNMNKYYKNTGITFKEARPGEDFFVMYDENTDETSEEFALPSVFDYASNDAPTSWDEVNLNVRKFFDRDRTVSKEFADQKEKVTNVIAAKLDDVDFLTDLLGENFDFSYVEKIEKGGKGEDYEIVMQALKNQVGKFGGFFGGDFETDVDFSLLSEQAVEKIIGDAVTKKFDYDKAIKSNEKEIEFANTITEENTTIIKIDNANRQAKINTLSKEGMALHLGLEKIKTLDPNSSEYQTQQKTNEELLREYEGWWRKNSEFLVDPITGISINPESPEAATAIVVNKEQLDKTEDKIKLTYGKNVEQAFMKYLEITKMDMSIALN